MWDNVAQEALRAAGQTLNIPNSKDFSDPALIAALTRLQRLLTKDRSARPAGYLSNPELRAAYLAAYLVPNALRVQGLLDREGPRSAPVDRLLDLGAGPLSASLGAAGSRLGRNLKEAVAVDTCRSVMQQGASILRSARPELQVRTIRASAFGRAASLPKGRFQLVVVANLLAELQGRQEQVRERALALTSVALSRTTPDGLLLLLEPGTRVAARNLMWVRDHLPSGACSILSPCPAVARCPLGAGRSWCHATHPVQLPTAVLELRRRAGLDSRALSYSYLLLTPRKTKPRARARLVSAVMREGPRRLRYACTPRGLVTLEWRGEASDPALERAFRGDAIERLPNQQERAGSRPSARGHARSGRKPGRGRPRRR